MNKVKVGSNMYPFLNEMSGGNGYTWNPIRGACPHQCSYCYVPHIMRGKQGDFRFAENEMKTNLGEGNFIFVGSSSDAWATRADDPLSAEDDADDILNMLHSKDVVIRVDRECDACGGTGTLNQAVCPNCMGVPSRIVVESLIKGGE